jgi:hypothetical protein
VYSFKELNSLYLTLVRVPFKVKNSFLALNRGRNYIRNKLIFTWLVLNRNFDIRRKEKSRIKNINRGARDLFIYICDWEASPSFAKIKIIIIN